MANYWINANVVNFLIEFINSTDCYRSNGITHFKNEWRKNIRSTCFYTDRQTGLRMRPSSPHSTLLLVTQESKKRESEWSRSVLTVRMLKHLKACKTNFKCKWIHLYLQHLIYFTDKKGNYFAFSNRTTQMHVQMSLSHQLSIANQ